MTPRLFLLGLFAAALTAPSSVRAACDLCANIPGDFAPTNVLPGSDGEPDSTCQALATELDVANLEQDSIDCAFGALVAVLYCCGDGIPCLQESTAVGLCFEEHESCAACQDDAGDGGMPQEQQDLGSLDFCETVDNQRTVDEFDSVEQCCPACAQPLTSWGNCINTECFEGGNGPFGTSEAPFHHSLGLALSLLVALVAMAVPPMM